MKIALIGPGYREIPPQGWGAVENIIWKYYNLLRERGHEVTIYNTKNIRSVAKDINAKDYDFVHLHYDEYARFFAKKLKQPFCATSHYGYINKSERWTRGYYSVFADFFKVPGVIPLSGEMAALYRKRGYEGFLRVLVNSIETEKITFRPVAGNGKAICLGKIEPRKRQAWLARAMDGLAEIDFVGPMADPAFKEGKTCRYLGQWTREEVSEHLTDYSCLILLSDGESAAPLVALEALAAGLSVVVTRAASANLEAADFITILPDDFEDPPALRDVLARQIANNGSLRTSAREFAISRFDARKILDDYIAIMEAFKKYDFRKKINRTMPGIDWRTYWFSRLWVFSSHIEWLRTMRNGIKKILLHAKN